MYAVQRATHWAANQQVEEMNGIALGVTAVKQSRRVEQPQYFSNPVWRNPSWKLPAGRYLVKVGVISAGEKCEPVFRLSNDVGQSGFRRERALSVDRVEKVPVKS